MDTADANRTEVRRQAEDRFAKLLRRDAEVKAYQQQQWDAEAAKIARLRALRLASEAAGQKSPKAPALSKRARTNKS